MTTLPTLPIWLRDEDDEERDELASVTGALAGPIAEDTVDALAAKLLRRLAYLNDEREKIDRREKAEHELVTTTYDRQRSRVDSRIAVTRVALEQLAQRMGFAKDSKKKSRRLAFGTLGRKDVSGKFVVLDKTKCAEWLKERAPDVVRATVTVSLAHLRDINATIDGNDYATVGPIDESKAKLDVLVADVDRWVKQSGGEIPDGCDVTEDRTEWTVEPVPAATIRAAED